MTAEPKTYDFVEMDNDDRDRLLASSISNQQRAGFKQRLDIRQFNCPDCSSPGFNSGWGSLDFTCGSSWSPSDDCEPFRRCRP